MSIKYKFREQDLYYFVSFAGINLIDLFIRNEYKSILLESWKYCQAKKGLEIDGWCIMSSRVHMITGTHGSPLQDIIRDMKKYTSIELRKTIKNHPGESRKEWILGLMEEAGTKNSQNSAFQLWQQENHPIELYNPKILHQKLDYIHHNPVAAGIVEKG